MTARRVLMIGLVASLMAACSSGTKSATSATASTTSTTPVVTTPTTAATTSPSTTPPTSAVSRVDPLRAVLDADSVAGLDLGATKDQVRARLGEPTSITPTRPDSTGTYELWVYQFIVPETSNAGLYLGFRKDSKFTPGLTDWYTSSVGPSSPVGIQVGDSEAKVQAAYGGVGQPIRGGKGYGLKGPKGGELRLLVTDLNHTVGQIVGGDKAAWSRTFSD